MKNHLQIFNYSVQNSNENILDVHIDGTIVDAETQQIYQDWWGDTTSVSFKSIRDQVIQSGKKTINFWVNSCGGHVGDAMAIHDWIVSLENQGYTITTNGIGMICSAATYILSASKNSTISKNSFYMIHNVSGGVYGDVNVIENYANTMRKFNDTIVDYYANLTGKDTKTITDWMNAETWFTGTEAVDNGFVKNLIENQNFTNSISSESFPFQNKAAMNLYNSFVKNKVKNLSDLDKNYLNTLLNHYQTSINLSKEILKTTTDSYVQALAGDIISDETDEIEEIQEQLAGTPEIENSKRSFLKNLKNNFNPENLDMNKLVQVIVDAFKTQNLVVTKDGEAPAQLTEVNLENALKEAFKDFNPEPTEEQLSTSVSNFFAKGLPETITNQIATAITEATKDFVTNQTIKNLETEVEELKKDLVNNAGGAKPRNNNPESTGNYEHEGIQWGSDK